METLRILAAAAFCAACCIVPPAAADTLAAAVEAGTLRAPVDFSHPVANFDIATLTETYDSGLSWTAFVQNARRIGSRANWAVEGFIDYRYRDPSPLSFYGNIGAGEFLSPVRDFTYVTLRGGADYQLNEKLVWNAVNLRYRDGLDADFAYRSSVAGTGLTYRVSEEYAVYTRVFAAFDTQFRFDGTGFGLGVRRFF